MRAAWPVLLLLVVCLFSPAVFSARSEQVEAEICVYGDSSGVVMAAIAARRLGKSVVLVSPTQHPGGMTVSGLGATDTGSREAIGGIAREFYRRIRSSYVQQYGEDSPQVRQCAGGFRFEPHVARDVMRSMMEEAGLPVRTGEPLRGVRRESGRLTHLVTAAGEISAKYFIDASYEGDLMAAAGVSYTVGREPNSRYGETLNGVHLSQGNHAFRVQVDPFIQPGNSASGLLPGVSPEHPGQHGDGDRRIQAYCFRLCLTDDPANRLPFSRPAGYEPARYELLLRYLQAGGWEGIHTSERLPNRKTDTNNLGAFSMNLVGGSYRWPEATPEERATLLAEHREYQQGLLWFLSSDARIPFSLRTEVNRWGFAADEFRDNGNWPYHLYVREARRMVAGYVMREQNCTGLELAPSPVGLASYRMDSHHVQRAVLDGRLVNEGNVEARVPRPYPISYHSIVPRSGECDNLLVPVALSASHIAFGSIRMEPVFMILGQSAATAAALALDENCPVQELSPGRLREQLLKDGQILDWGGPAETPRQQLVLDGIVVDDIDARLDGEWRVVRGDKAAAVGGSYLHDAGGKSGICTATFMPKLPRDGFYEVVILYPPHTNRASRAPVTLMAEGLGGVGGEIDQRSGSGSSSLGVVYLPAGHAARAVVTNAGADGVVAVDAVQFIPR